MYGVSQTVDKVYFFDLCCKSLAEFRRPQTAEEGRIVFSGGVYVGKHTFQAASVRAKASARRGLHPLEKMLAFLRSVSKFFDTLRNAILMYGVSVVYAFVYTFWKGRLKSIFGIDRAVAGESPHRPPGRRRFCAVQAFSPQAKTLAQAEFTSAEHFDTEG